MRIAYINVTSVMSTGRIAVELCRMAEAGGHRALLCHARGTCPGDVPSLRVGNRMDTAAHALLARVTDRAGFYSRRSTRQLVSELEKYKPDLVHLHNIHGYYLHLPTLFEYLKRNDIPTVWTLHDCWAFTGHCAYYTMAEGAPPPDGERRRAACGEGCERWLNGCGNCVLLREYPRSWLVDQSARNWREKRALFSGVPHMVLVTPSEWLKDQVKRSFLGSYPVYALPNGIDLTAFAPCVDENFMRDTARFYGLDKAGNRPLIISAASAWDGRKGLDDLIELSEVLGEDYCVAAVGLDEYQIRSLPPHTVLGVPPTGNLNDLCALYTAADLYISLSHGETMGMTLVEALACGTQVLCYDTTAMPEIVTPEVGEVAPMGDMDAVADAVRRLCRSHKSPADCRARAAAYAAPLRFGAYLKLYHNMYVHSPAYIRAVEEACAPALAGKRKPKNEL